jgi:hypothetical protein
MVTRRYFLDKPNRPSTVMRHLNWNAIPAVINGIGAFEGHLERIAVATRRFPTLALGAALALGFALATGSSRKRQH